MKTIVYLHKELMSGVWEGQAIYKGENYIVSLWYAVEPSLPIARGVGQGTSYLSARDRAVENSGHSESEWSRLLPELDDLVYEATHYGMPEVPVQGKES